MRAVVQGLDLRASWERFLRVEGEPGDARAIRSTVTWIRDEFAAAARRHQRFGVARLVRFDATRLRFRPTVLPSLRDFAHERDLEDFSEAEQIEAFEAEFSSELAAANRHARRRERLIAQQLQAIEWLETLTAQSPRAADPVSAWLNPTLAAHLNRAGIVTVAELVDRINGIGRGWHSSIRALGVGKSERIVAWLRRHERSIALGLGAHVDRPRSAVPASVLASIVPRGTGVLPLEKLIVPVHLDGSAGRFRLPQSTCRLDATTDLQAISAWLASKVKVDGDGRGLSGRGGSSHTLRAYRREAERLVLWAVIERGLAMSSLAPEDCLAYREFIADPQPRSRWCGPRSMQRWSPLWRPFEGPLGPSAQQQTNKILANLFAFLVDQRYLVSNPWRSPALPEPAPRMRPAGRSLAPHERDLVHQALAALPETPASRRLRITVLLLQAGLRLSDVVQATFGDLRPPGGSSDAGAAGDDALWLLQTARRAGAGRRSRVAVSCELVALLQEELVGRGLAPDLGNSKIAGAHLLGRLDGGPVSERTHHHATSVRTSARPSTGPGGVKAAAVHDQLKRFLKTVATRQSAGGNVGAANRLEKVSAHWLRGGAQPTALPTARECGPRDVREPPAPQHLGTAAHG